jgi:rhamnulokinase
MCYREAFEGLEQLKGNRIDALHIVGGGAKDTLLNQFSADAIGREIVAGPYEATAIGNIMMQVKSTGEVKDFAEMREVITRSFTVSHFEPKQEAQWTEAFGRYQQIVRRGSERK